jgi:hypothetical protein
MIWRKALLFRAMTKPFRWAGKPGDAGGGPGRRRPGRKLEKLRPKLAQALSHEN